MFIKEAALSRKSDRVKEEEWLQITNPSQAATMTLIAVTRKVLVSTQKFVTKKSSVANTRADSAANPAAKALFVKAAEWLQRDELLLAEVELDKHLALAPQSFPGLSMKALIASQTDRFELAESIWRVLLKTKPDYKEAYGHLGEMYLATQRVSEAERCFRSALALDPRSDFAHVGLGETQRKQGLYDEALKSFRRSNQNNSNAQCGIGGVLREQGNFDHALEAYERALRIDPTNTRAVSHYLYCQYFVDSLEMTQRFATAKALAKAFTTQPLVSKANNSPPDPERPLRIGVISGYFQGGPTGYFFETVLAEISQKSSHWIAFSNHSEADEVTARLKPRFSKWHQIDQLSDASAAQLIMDEKIDILFDLAGHMGRNRLTMFALKPAPIQISWLGYWGTTGLDAMDYVLTDPNCVPKHEEHWFTEKILHLPHSRFCFSPPLDSPEVSGLPVVSGKPFTFACFQELSKINDRVLKTWARVLSAVPTARLRIQSMRLGYKDVMEAFSDRVRAAGINESQVELHSGSLRYGYLQSYSDVDLLLDTFPYPGGTTTMEALWMGVPTLTNATPGMLGRQGAAMLIAAGIPEFVCNSTDDYVNKAIAYASPEKARVLELSQLRGRLRQQVKASPLMDAPRFATDLDNALRGVWRTWCSQKQTRAPVSA